MANILNHTAITRELKSPLAVMRSVSNLVPTPAAVVTQNFTFDHADLKMPVEMRLTVRASLLWVSYEIDIEMFSIMSGAIEGGTMERFFKSTHNVNSIVEILFIVENVAACAKELRAKAHTDKHALIVSESRKRNVIGYLIAAYQLTQGQAEQIAINGSYSFQECDDIASATRAKK